MPSNNESTSSADILKRLESIAYCINCTEAATCAVGTFAYDEFLFNAGHGHFAIGPVFSDIDLFYVWSKEQGFSFFSRTSAFVMQRKFP